jgi:aryl-alcohol dehydrogenase-like predicted oxidoreductase
VRTAAEIRPRSNNYQNEESETWVGEWMESRGIRDQIVLATKFSSNFRKESNDRIQSNFAGNNSKSLHISVNRSLKKLRTDYIDVVGPYLVP